MFAFIVRRIIQALLVMLVIGMVGFVIQNQIGDPVRDLVGERVTPAERAVIRDQLGLNDPFYIQYIRFVKKACQGDLGLSFFYKKPALEVIVSKAPATIELVIVTALILIVVSIPAGIYSAIYPRGWLSDRHHVNLFFRGRVELAAFLWPGRNSQCLGLGKRLFHHRWLNASDFAQHIPVHDHAAAFYPSGPG